MPIRAVTGKCPHLLDTPCQPSVLGTAPGTWLSHIHLLSSPSPVAVVSRHWLVHPGWQVGFSSGGSLWGPQNTATSFPYYYPGKEKEVSVPLGQTVAGTHCLVRCISCPHALTLGWCGRGLSKDGTPSARTNSIHAMGLSVSFQSTNVGTWAIALSEECLPSTHEALQH